MFRQLFEILFKCFDNCLKYCLNIATIVSDMVFAVCNLLYMIQQLIERALSDDCVSDYLHATRRAFVSRVPCMRHHHHRHHSPSVLMSLKQFVYLAFGLLGTA